MLKFIARHRSNIRVRYYHHQYHHRDKLVTLTTRTHANKVTTSASSRRYKQNQSQNTSNTGLSLLPLPHLLRNIVISSACSSPAWSSLSYRFLRWMLNNSTNSHSQHDSERLSPLLKWILKNTLYAHFCAGENRAEIIKTLKSLNALRYDGVILEYALEILDTGEQGEDEGRRDGSAADNNKEAIATWKRGMLETVDMVEPGNFVGLKWSGLGIQAVQLLKDQRPPTKAMATAMYEVCHAASRKGVKLLPAAEASATNTGIHEWSLALQQKFNVNVKSETSKPNKSRNVSSATVIYSTYQAYLKSTPQRLLHDLDIASRNGFTLGVKLVRGAYLASEPQRDLIWDTKEQTDEAYDTITRALLQARIEDLRTMVLPSPSRETNRSKIEKENEREKDAPLSPSEIRNKTFAFPNVNLLLATHNKHSVLEAQRIQAEQAHERGRERGRAPLVDLAFAQLQGMADEISCGLVADKMRHHADNDDDDSSSVSDHDKRVSVDADADADADAHYCHHPKVYKCLAWGTVEQCLSYLLRRADENKEAAERTADTSRAMMREVWRRMKIKTRMGGRK